MGGPTVTIKSALKKLFVILLALLISGLLLSIRGDTQAALTDGKQKGMSFAAWWPGFYSSPDADQALSELREDGADWISLIVTRYQDTFTSTTIYSAPATPTDADLVHVINQAQVSTRRKLQEETQKDLNALLLSILDKAFKGEL